MNRWKIAFYLVAIFLLGVASGAFIHWQITKYRNALPLTTERITEHILSRIDSRVNLTPSQRENIVPIIRKAASDIVVVNHNVRGQISVIISNADAQIARELTPEQRAKFEQMERERREFFRKRYPAPANTP
jgi:tRNA uridine 5-carbamoylmethylation protein Kti12